MRVQDIIARKRDGAALSADEIAFFVRGYTQGDIPDYQASALLMAVYLRGMDDAETAHLTRAMAESGTVLDLGASLPEDARGRPTLDKHSTGGVGDKTSLVVVPLLAAAGALLCKMSGRGLGHTGGTLDKLEAIPGFRVGLTPKEMVAQVARVGACLAGQTGALAPADKKLYALRDATATVGSLPLIVSSILSKKLAGGADHFLFDVKTGGGAILPTEEEARDLARALVEGARRNGRRAAAVLSDMSPPLGRAIGNALEVREAVDLLRDPDAADGRLLSLCLLLAAEGILLAGLAPDRAAARSRAEEVLRSGAALGVFREIVAAQGGDVSVVDDPALLPAAPVRVAVSAPRAGFVSAIDARALGEAVVALGGGRAKKEDDIDPAVGVEVYVTVGTPVAQGDALATVHAADEEQAARILPRIAAAFALVSEAVPEPPLVREVIG